MISSSKPSPLLSGRQLAAAILLEQRARHRERVAKTGGLIDGWREDFVGFAAELDVIDKDGVRTRVKPTPMLAQFEAQRTGRDIVLKPRQVWFTTWELAHDLHWLLTQDSAHVVVVCPSDSEDNAIREMAMRVNVMLGLDAPGSGQGLIGRHPWLAIGAATGKPSGDDMLRWEEGELRFGSARLEIKGAGATSAAARKVGRSGTIQRLHITEISSFEYASETWTAIEACVPTGVRNSITIESTPQGAAGLFHRLYTDAKKRLNSFKTFFFAWMKHGEYRTRLAPGEVIKVQTPREREMVRKYGASAEQVKWYRAKVADKTQDLADQEYPMDEETCWLVSGRLFLNAERTKELLSESRDPLVREHVPGTVPDPSVENELLVWAHPVAERGVTYVVIGDPSEGVVGGDPCAAAVYRRDTGEHVASLHGLWRTHEFAAALEAVAYRYGTAQIVVERVNHGHAVLNALLRLGVGLDTSKAYPNIFHDTDEKAGWKTGEVPRATACEAFEAAHRLKKWTSPDRDALAEMQQFVILKTGKAAATPGAHDDRVITHIIAWVILSKPRTQGTNTVKGDESRWGSDDRGYG